jgi:surfactin synthase thioesterase subunit
VPTSVSAGKWLPRASLDLPSRLFCLPYSGVGASMYGQWPDRIADIEVCPVQLPGREGRLREPHFGTYENLAEAVVDGLAPWLDRPFGLFGHCSSALIAFEIVSVLQRRGLPAPARLFVSSQVAPHDGPHGRYLGMTDEQLRAELIEVNRITGQQELEPSVLDLVLEVLRSDVTANRAYRLAGPRRVATAITLIGWSQDEEVDPGLMTGWRAYTDRIRTVVLPGRHHTFLTAPAALRAELAGGMAVGAQQ